MCCGWLLDCSGWLLGILSHFQHVVVRVLSLRSSVIHGFVTETWYSHHTPIMSCFHVSVRLRVCTWLVICLLAMCLCFCFVWARGFCPSFLCAMCSLVICLDPTHLVTCLLIHFPQLLSLVTLPICSLYNLLVFAVLCGFVLCSLLLLVGQVKLLVKSNVLLVSC